MEARRKRPDHGGEASPPVPIYSAAKFVPDLRDEPIRLDITTPPREHYREIRSTRPKTARPDAGNQLKNLSPTRRYKSFATAEVGNTIRNPLASTALSKMATRSAPDR